MRVDAARVSGVAPPFVRGFHVAALALVGLLIIRGCHERIIPPLVAGPLPHGRAFAAQIRVGVLGRDVNRRVLGNNIQWVDRGDELLSSAGEVDPNMFALVRDLGVTVLRYPGGAQSDVFHWQAGEGPASSRGTSEHFFSRKAQRIVFGTTEFLDLCRRLAAEPVITVNTASGTPEQAAAWVRSVNLPVGGIVRGPVQFWEVGNEPYLREPVRPELAAGPEVFADRANAFIRAMRTADSNISIGVPIRNDRIGGLPVVHFPGFAERILRGVTEPYDFVSLHDAYFPLVFDASKDIRPDSLFLASMAAYQTLEKDLQQTRNLLERIRPGRPLPFAITEYNALYTLGGPVDHYVASLGGAMYVADVLRTLAARGDVLMANFWSLAGNGFFGAVSNRGQVRPAYQVLKAYSEILHGRLLDLQIETPTFDSPEIGAVPSTRGVPTIAAIATADRDHIRSIILNKSVTSPVDVTLISRTETSRILITARELSDEQIFAPSHEAGLLRWSDVSVSGNRFPLQLRINAHSMLWVEIQI